uniref:Retrotransposon protein n=1 Tax=Panagrellus redivivus TaxID=6233 RepID=A0A7E4UV47_PANRE
MAPCRPALHSFDSFLSFETTMEHVAEGSFRDGLRRLANKITAEEAHINEARVSILYWRRKEGNNKLLHHELSAQALLLISQIRLDVYRELVTRIHTFYRMSVGPHPVSKAMLSCFKVNTITVNLCKNYYTRNNPDNSGKYYAFVIVLSSHEKVIATELQHTVEARGMHAKRIRIDEEIVFNNLPLTFQINWKFLR